MAEVLATAPHLFVIMGGTGDLTSRKLMPALYNLAHKGHLSESWRVLGVARSAELNDETYREWARQALGEAGLGGKDMSDWCGECLHFFSLGDGTDEDYARLKRRIEEIEKEAVLPGNRTFYLALPAAAFAPTAGGLGRAGLNASAGWTRLVVEKPFGHDLQSCLELHEAIGRHFREDQIYRIDHFLGKETVQNLLVFRFGNSIFENLWNRDRIESVQITVAETLGVEDRAAFYEKTGALRDIVQNHLTQILCLVAMEVPMAFEAEAIHHEKLKVLSSIQPLAPEDVVFGQYESGQVGDDRVVGYRQEEGIAADSRTETYVAMRLALDTWRWQGTPFYIRTGKRLDRKLTQIVVAFRRPPICLFESMGSCLLHRNDLFITLQPDEGFSLVIDVKTPGEPLGLKRIPLGFRYQEAFGQLPDAYETLILDILRGNQTLFVHADEVRTSWRLYDPLLQLKDQVKPYAAGSAGPIEAERLLQKDGHSWLTQ
jgi:glucose-6-phosphate 1-dehydrogenase